MNVVFELLMFKQDRYGWQDFGEIASQQQWLLFLRVAEFLISDFYLKNCLWNAQEC